MEDPPEHDITRLLREVEEGNLSASDELLRSVYFELKRLARSHVRRTPVGETLQPTALVHEAYMRLAGQNHTDWHSRRQFFFVAGRAMHDILVEEARRKASRKRGGDWKRADPEALEIPFETPAEDMLALDEALRSLEADDPRKAEVVRLRFFAGLNEEETAEILGVTARTIRREWRYIRARLFRELGSEDALHE